MHDITAQDIGIVFEDQEEVRCALHAFEFYAKARKDAGKPTTRIDLLIECAKALLTTASIEAERVRNERK